GDWVRLPASSVSTMRARYSPGGGEAGGVICTDAAPVGLVTLGRNDTRCAEFQMAADAPTEPPASEDRNASVTGPPPEAGSGEPDVHRNPGACVSSRTEPCSVPRFPASSTAVASTVKTPSSARTQ